MPDPYTRYGGLFYRYSSTKGNVKRYLCTRYEQNGEWTAIKQGCHCPGVMIVIVGEDEGNDLIYLDKKQLCLSTRDHTEMELRCNMELGLPDNRPSFSVINPALPTYGLDKSSIASIIRDLEEGGGWAPLTGRSNRVLGDRWYYPDMIENDELYNKVSRHLSWYVRHIQRIYPALTVLKFGALKSAPNAKSQYEGHFQRLHSDYPDAIRALPPDLRPLSVIVALDGFELIRLPHRFARREEMITSTVLPGEAVYFTGECLHSGGVNQKDHPVYRLFFYMCSRIQDVPQGRVRLFNWNGEGDDAQVQEDVESNVKNYMNRWGRITSVPESYST